LEVHAHSHSHGKKSWKSYFWEFLMLFLAVSLGFYAENLREKMIHKKEVNKSMHSLLSDLRSDVSFFDSVLNKNQYSCKMADSLVTLLHDDISNTRAIYYTARSTTANVGYYYTNAKSFELMKSSGLLRFIHSESLLDSMGSYYVTFQWLANQTELTRLKLDQIHKGNSLLFDSYVFSQMMNIQFPVYNLGYNIINQPEGQPELLSTDPRSVNAVSLNYHYYSTTAKFYNRSAMALRDRAARLIELIRKEYSFD
jgi:hypothetical protein